MNKGEANRQCYLQKKRNENCDCWLCGYEDKCWKNEDVCTDCIVAIEGAEYEEESNN